MEELHPKCSALNDPTTRDNIVKEINRFIIEAGKLALDYYYKPITASMKKDQSIVSEADIEVEKLLIKNLNNLIPNAIFVGEEASESLTVEEKKQKAKQAFESDYIWAIDPIDGTTNFTAHFGDWAISIGLLAKCEEGYIPFLGSIYVPCKDKLYFTDGSKSYVVINASKENVIKNEIEQVAYSEQDLNSKIFAAHYERSKRYGLDKVRYFRYPGALVVELAAAAAGESIGTILHANLWDITAGLAICRTSGIKMYDIKTEKEIKAFKIRDFAFSDTKSWKLNQDYLISNESGKQILFKYIKRD